MPLVLGFSTIHQHISGKEGDVWGFPHDLLERACLSKSLSNQKEQGIPRKVRHNRHKPVTTLPTTGYIEGNEKSMNRLDWEGKVKPITTRCGQLALVKREKARIRLDRVIGLRKVGASATHGDGRSSTPQSIGNSFGLLYFILFVS